MVYVVVMVKTKEGKAEEFVRLFKTVASTVEQEKGCVQYIATVDAPGAPPETVDRNTVTILEKWECIEDIQNHMATPHMKEFFERQKDLVEGTSVMKMLREA
jgi:quinol monooxygenase YgiN